MAKRKTTTPQPAPVIDANSMQMKIGAYAVSQIEALVDMLNRESHLQEDDFNSVVRGTAARIKKLTDAAYWAVTDESGNAEQMAELYELVHCRKMEASHG